MMDLNDDETEDMEILRRIERERRELMRRYMFLFFFKFFDSFL